jgi:hypothetical protein
MSAPPRPDQGVSGGADERTGRQPVEPSTEATRPAIRHVGLVAKSGSRDATHTSRELTEWLERRGLRVACDDATRRATGAERPRPSSPSRALRPGPRPRR